MAQFEKILYMGFKATLNFRKFKVARIGDKLLVKINYSSNDITFMFSLASWYVPVCASMFFVTGFNGTTHFNCKCVKRLVMRKLVIT